MNLEQSRRMRKTVLPPICVKAHAGAVSLLLAASGLLAGCGSSGALTNAPAPSEDAVIVGTQQNSLPAPPAQTDANQYAGVDIGNGGISWNLNVSHPGNAYDYQQRQGVGGASVSSGGLFTPVGDFEFLSDTLQLPYQFFGLNAEINSGVSLFVPAFSGFPSGNTMVLGVLQPQTGCLAPNGSVAVDFLQVPPLGSTTPSTDALYGETSLTYKDGLFSYSGTTQFATGGATASTNTIPLANSYCVQADAGYALQSSAIAGGTTGASTSEDTLLYLGATGVASGAASVTTTTAGTGGAPPTVSTANTGFVGAVEPSAAIDLSKVTAGAYKGFNVFGSDGDPDPAYFGASSVWLTNPVFQQTGTSLVGSSEPFSTYQFTFPAPTVTGNILIDFGTQDAKHNGLFPNASFTEQDPNNVCPAAQQSTGSDGLTYCTFPVAALISESYGKYAIFVSGHDQTTGTGLFYALVQD